LYISFVVIANILARVVNSQASDMVEFNKTCQSKKVTEVIIKVTVQEYCVKVKVKAGLASVPNRPKTERVKFFNGSS
jgi:hypothetical protein